ncbi:inositol monophosphatase family protein [Spirillospora sp. CA-128828]|uniref:inositol monophosphatase family protein n=1 Tax=Spirillospora sp. CA-128828 TaxID=3240033 RepID=UPI003D89F0BB
MHDDADLHADVAGQAVAAALEVARGHFGRTLDVEVKGPRGDVVTQVDREAERLIVATLHERFPTHTIEAEESGTLFAGSDHVWLVDPLDGTNNYAYGLPVYGAAVTLCHRGEPIVAAIGEAHTGDVACAVAGRGVTVNGRPFERTSPLPAALPATALWVGYHTQGDERLDALTSLLHARSRRLFSTWAPTIDVFLYLRGGLDALTVYQCTGTELLGSLLLLREAGAEIRGADGELVRRLADLPDLSFVGSPAVTLPLVGALSPAATP